MTEEYGQVIQMPIIEDIPLLIQITWSKFWWACQQSSETTIIGDIDLLPLQSNYFFESLSTAPDSNYAHLDCDGITQLSNYPSWVGTTKENVSLVTHHPTNLPGHYHCARGDIFKTALKQNNSREEELRNIVNSGIFHNYRGKRASDPIEQHGLWCAEEFFSTKAIRENIHEGKINFSGFSLVNGIEPAAGPTCKGFNGDRIDRTMYDKDSGDYIYDHDRLVSKDYIDLHCIRPFSHVDELERDRRWKANYKVLDLAGVI